MTDLDISKTNRGFSLIEFDDRYGVGCSLQKSSLATEDAIWFGCDDPNPRVLSPNGWVTVPMPEDCVVNTRMHLTQEQVKDLLPYLTKFVETGEIS